MSQVTVVDHPLVQHKLTLLRKTSASSLEFRTLLRELGWILGAEALKNLPLEDIEIETPVSPMIGKQIAGKKLVLVSILRAGDGLLYPLLDLVPNARMGAIGMARNEETLQPEIYSLKLPAHLEERPVVVLDPMLATAGSAIAAIDELKKRGAKNLRFIALVASPEGVKAFTTAHPDVDLYTAAIDDMLNDVGYIVPGLGDAGDRIFGTKPA